MKHDSILGDRLKEVGIFHWKGLAQKTGLSTLRLRQIRSGAIAEIKWGELSKLAQALNWSMVELQQKLELLPHSPENAPPLAHTSNGLEVELRQQCQRLRGELDQQKLLLSEAFRQSTFEQLQTLLTNYPTAAEMAHYKPDLPAKNITALFTPLNNLLENWGYEPIGSPWQAVLYNPQFHQADSDDIQPGDAVYIRFVGYREDSLILCPAKVSRTLPQGIKPSF